MSLQWSPGDLDRQRHIVGIAVERAQNNRVRLLAARRRLAGRLQAMAVPVAVSAAAIAAAFALGRYTSVHRAAASRVGARSERDVRRSAGIQSLLPLAMTLAQIYLRARALIAPPAQTVPAERVH